MIRPQLTMTKNSSLPFLFFFLHFGNGLAVPPPPPTLPIEFKNNKMGFRRGILFKRG
jgi:hypothetical protein